MNWCSDTGARKLMVSSFFPDPRRHCIADMRNGNLATDGLASGNDTDIAGRPVLFFGRLGKQVQPQCNQNAASPDEVTERRGITR